MNLTYFLKQTDALTAKYSTEQLIAFIHEIGRGIPEQRREDFWEELRAAGGITQAASEKALKDMEFEKTYSEIYSADGFCCQRTSNKKITGLLEKRTEGIV